MNVLEKIPREGSISSKQLAANTGTNEEVLSTFLFCRRLTFRSCLVELIIDIGSSIDTSSHLDWRPESTWG